MEIIIVLVIVGTVCLFGCAIVLLALNLMSVSHDREYFKIQAEHYEKMTKQWENKYYGMLINLRHMQDEE